MSGVKVDDRGVVTETEWAKMCTFIAGLYDHLLWYYQVPGFLYGKIPVSSTFTRKYLNSTFS